MVVVLSFWWVEKIFKCFHVFLPPIIILSSQLEVTTYVFFQLPKILIPCKHVKINREMIRTGGLEDSLFSHEASSFHYLASAELLLRQITVAFGGVCTGLTSGSASDYSPLLSLGA